MKEPISNTAAPNTDDYDISHKASRSVISDEDKVKVFEISSNGEFQLIQTITMAGDVNCLTMSEDEEYLIIGTWGKLSVYQRFASYEKIQELTYSTHKQSAICISDDNRYIAEANRDHNIYLYEKVGTNFTYT